MRVQVLVAYGFTRPSSALSGDILPSKCRAGYKVHASRVSACVRLDVAIARNCRPTRRTLAPGRRVNLQQCRRQLGKLGVSGKPGYLEAGRRQRPPPTAASRPDRLQPRLPLSPHNLAEGAPLNRLIVWAVLCSGLPGETQRSGRVRRRCLHGARRRLQWPALVAAAGQLATQPRQLLGRPGPFEGPTSQRRCRRCLAHRSMHC